MLEALRAVLGSISGPVVAVSGGVDSITLAAVVIESQPAATLYHAESPAVPREATQRVRDLAGRRGWQLQVIRAGEFDDPRYRANPVDRCFYCKTNLYGRIRAQTGRQILSGANLDDLGEYRPGLDAAREHGVRHPYIEAGIDKRGVRAISRFLGLDEVAELPSSPCLSSRVETGIRIEAHTLGFVHRVEKLVSDHAQPRTVRCRIRAHAIVVELDGDALARLDQRAADALRQAVERQPHRPPGLPVRFEEYRNGSAFLRS